MILEATRSRYSRRSVSLFSFCYTSVCASFPVSLCPCIFLYVCSFSSCLFHCVTAYFCLHPCHYLHLFFCFLFASLFSTPLFSAHLICLSLCVCLLHISRMSTKVLTILGKILLTKPGQCMQLWIAPSCTQDVDNQDCVHLPLIRKRGWIFQILVMLEMISQHGMSRSAMWSTLAARAPHLVSCGTHKMNDRALSGSRVPHWRDWFICIPFFVSSVFTWWPCWAEILRG